MAETDTGEFNLNLRVASHRSGAQGIVVLTLESPDGESLPLWEPGAHIDLHLGDALVRQYSLCGDPRDRSQWRIAVLRDPNTRGGSAHVHDAMSVGDVVNVCGPRNNFSLVAASRYIFIAGGIGITPLLPMIAAARAAGSTWELHYGGRARESMAFLHELATAEGGSVTVYSQDEVGVLPLAEILRVPQEDTLIYCCGPGPLLDAVEACCDGVWPASSLHVERFSPRTLILDAPDTAFEVELAASKVTIMVPPEMSILQSLDAAGIDVPSSCQEGTCGTCETALITGEGDHRDSLLSKDEQEANESIFICVSRAKSSRLVLDL